MSASDNEQIISIGIVGGGKGGSEILSFLAVIPSLKVQYIIDKNPNAHAFSSARQFGIHSSTDLRGTVSSIYTDFIIEATGSSQVFDLIQGLKHEKTEIISSHSALFLFKMLDGSRRKINADVKSEIQEIRTGIMDDVKSANKFLTSINDLTFVMNILSINAAIEAARSGEAGAGFSIVAEQIQGMSERTRSMAESIREITGSIAHLSEKIDTAIIKLEH